MDAESKLEKVFTGLEFHKNKEYAWVGIDVPGKKNIEGLLPESIVTKVFTSNSALAQAAINGTAEEKNTASKQLKKLMLSEFKKLAKPGDEYFKGFYPIVRMINKALGE